MSEATVIFGIWNVWVFWLFIDGNCCNT